MPLPIFKPNDTLSAAHMNELARMSARRARLSHGSGLSGNDGSLAAVPGDDLRLVKAQENFTADGAGLWKGECKFYDFNVGDSTYSETGDAFDVWSHTEASGSPSKGQVFFTVYNRGSGRWEFMRALVLSPGDDSPNVGASIGCCKPCIDRRFMRARHGKYAKTYIVDGMPSRLTPDGGMRLHFIGLSSGLPHISDGWPYWESNTFEYTCDAGTDVYYWRMVYEGFDEDDLDCRQGVPILYLVRASSAAACTDLTESDCNGVTLLYQYGGNNFQGWRPRCGIRLYNIGANWVKPELDDLLSCELCVYPEEPTSDPASGDCLDGKALSVGRTTAWPGILYVDITAATVLGVATGPVGWLQWQPVNLVAGACDNESVYTFAGFFDSIWSSRTVGDDDPCEWFNIETQATGCGSAELIFGIQLNCQGPYTGMSLIVVPKPHGAATQYYEIGTTPGSTGSITTVATKEVSTLTPKMDVSITLGVWCNTSGTRTNFGQIALRVYEP